MRQTLTIAALILTLGLSACADHSSGLIAFDSPSQPPVTPGDQHAIDPVVVGGGGAGGTGGNTGGGTTGGGTGGGTTGGGTGGGTTGGGNPPPSVGSPVPEPGTMLLVGTGLAGAAFLRRRKQIVVVEG